MCCEPSNIGEGDCVPHVDCWCTPIHRCFLSREEKIEMLERYKRELEKEIRGVEQRLQEIKE